MEAPLLFILAFPMILIILCMIYVIKQLIPKIGETPEERKKAVERARQEIFEDYGI